MTVKTFVQPDYTSQSGSQYPTNIDASAGALASIANQFAPHEQSTPNMTVRVEAGRLQAYTAITVVAAQNTATITAPTTNPRIDRIVINSTAGVVSVITGVASASPTAPAITENSSAVAQVLLQTSSTAITNSMITDERSTIFAALGNYKGQVPLLVDASSIFIGGNVKSRLNIDTRLSLNNITNFEVASHLPNQSIAAGATYDHTFPHGIASSENKILVAINVLTTVNGLWEVFWANDFGYRGREVGPEVTSLTSEVVPIPAADNFTIRIKNRHSAAQNFTVRYVISPTG